jgi:hypothetical protein
LPYLIELSGIVYAGLVVLPERIDEIHLFFILVLLALQYKHIEILKRDLAILLNSVRKD